MKEKKPKVEVEVSPSQFTGLLRAVSAVEHKLSSTAPKDRPEVGILYWAELTLDTGRVYKTWSRNKPYLENLKIYIDKEITGDISENEENIKLNLPPDYMDKFPREKIASPVKQQPYTNDTYWKDKSIRDVETNAAIEMQFYMKLASDYFLALGRLTDQNTEELIDKALAYGMEKYKQYGRTYGESAG